MGDSLGLMESSSVNANIDSLVAYEFPDALRDVLVLGVVDGLDVELLLGEGEPFGDSVDADNSRGAFELGPVRGERTDRAESPDGDGITLVHSSVDNGVVRSR